MKPLTILVAALLLTACDNGQPSEGEQQVALSNCSLVTPDDGQRSSVLVCSDEFMQIGPKAFVAKYRSR